LFAVETARWLSELRWDTASAWRDVEDGRVLGTVPGLAALDEWGAVAGWIFGVPHRETLQIGGLVASTAAATRALLDGICSGPAASKAHSIMLFVFANAPGLDEALARLQLTGQRYDYLVKPLAKTSGASTASLRTWQPRDLDRTTQLFASAYPGADALRPFAPHGTDDEWRDYVQQLVGGHGCGAMLSDSCFVAEHTDRLDGLVLVTHLSSATAHIPQLAVDPHRQGAGLGRRLVEAACGSAARHGYEQMTLLVARENTRARQLYDTSGFRPSAEFVAAGGRIGRA
jgi:ribosomal protein S18 acetylase RimI-like enzyme